jgi:hypothetical protein
MIKYVFKEPLAIKNAKRADAQVLGETLDAIRKERGGRLTPKAVVEAARDEASPLHLHFEWDDAAAAEAYRRDQAREIIRVVRVEDDDGEVRPAYFSVRSKGGQSYAALEDVLSSRDLQLEVRRAAKRDLDAWESRYRELSEICELVQPAQRRLSEEIDRAEVRH